MNWEEILSQIKNDNQKVLARCISLIENEYTGYENILQLLPNTNVTQTIGITGPPGSGKSTIVDLLIGLLVNEGKKVAVLCVDPSSPFNLGALLGDRIRMSEWYNHKNVFIRSLATRGSLGGLHPKIIEITDIVKAARFDYIIIETVGVGQSEIEIAGLADTTVVVLIPEAGDEIQTMKAGLMEIADVFVVNKSDRPGADIFLKNLRMMLAPVFSSQATEIEIIKTTALQKEGIQNMLEAIKKNLLHFKISDKKQWLLVEKAYYLIQKQRMKNIDKKVLKNDIEKLLEKNMFNLYQLVAKYK